MATVSGHPTSYDSGYSAYSVSNLDRGYTDSSSTNYATINLTRGENAVTSIYYNFPLNIPSNATITSVSCTAKCYINNTQSNRITTRTVQLYSGSTAKGSASTVSTSTSEFTMSAGSWTAAELNNAKIRVYGVRGTNSTTSSYYFRFYGATLTVEYSEAATGTNVRVKVNGVWEEASKVLVKQNGTWKEAKSIKVKNNGSWQ